MCDYGILCTDEYTKQSKNWTYTSDGWVVMKKPTVGENSFPSLYDQEIQVNKNSNSDMGNEKMMT